MGNYIARLLNYQQYHFYFLNSFLIQSVRLISFSPYVVFVKNSYTLKIFSRRNKFHSHLFSVLKKCLKILEIELRFITVFIEVNEASYELQLELNSI